MKYFTIAELTRSNTATKYGIDNTPDGKSEKRLIMLVDNVLDPLREAFGAPIRVNSGYRCKELNAHPEINGSATSEHVFGMAADITAIDDNDKRRRAKNQRLFELCISLGLPFHQLIDEYGFKWVHVSFNPAAENQRDVKHVK